MLRIRARVLALAAIPTTLLLPLGGRVFPQSARETIPPPQATPGRGPESPSPTPSAEAENQEALARIRQFLAGRENEPAERVFKNINLLRGKPAGRLPAMMSALTGLVGARCSSCHVAGDWASDDLVGKQTARRHFAMQSMLNERYFEGRNAITCWTCHRGHWKPAD